MTQENNIKYEVHVTNTNHEYMDNIHLRELLFVRSFLKIFSMLSSFPAHFVLFHTVKF